ncbi:MAG: type II/IV secretion system ATPase subunit [Thermoplasmata archaeon]
MSGAGRTILVPSALDSSDGERVLERTAIDPPYSAVRVLLDRATETPRYEVLEATLSSEEARIAEELHAALPHILPGERRPRSAHERIDRIERSAGEYLDAHHRALESDARGRIVHGLVRDALGYGPIDAMVRDPEVEDISCDGVGVPLYVFHARYESIPTNVRFSDESTLDSFVLLLGQRCGRSLSVARPMLDGTTPEGHRVQATYGREVTSRGASFTIRRFRDRPFTPVDLVLSGTANEEMLAYFWLGAEYGESLIVCGGPGAGKTSTLNAIAVFIAPSAKIVSIEDVRELHLPHENWVAAATRDGIGDRGPDGKSLGEVDMFDLVRAALRQRPSHILVGEVRGREAYAMFQAMATGHATYSTMHADSVRSMVARLENPPIHVPRVLLSSLRQVAIEAQVPTPRGTVRRLLQIVEIVRLEPETNELVTNPVYEWDPTTDTFHFQGHSYLLDRVAVATHRSSEEMRAEFERRIRVIRYLVDRRITDYRELWRSITEYYRDPKALLERIERSSPEEGRP